MIWRNKKIFFVVFASLFAALSFGTQSKAAYPYSQINSNGFGDVNNTMVTALAYYDGYMYAGTSNSVTGAQIWRSSDDTNWQKVVDGGLTRTTINRVQSLIVFDGYLYAGTVASALGAEIWRTNDGTNWQQVGEDGMGSVTNNNMHTATIFDNYLYFSTINGNGAEIWRSTNGTDWELANTPGFGKPQNSGIYGIHTFDGYIYAGTYNPGQGAELWRSSSGTDWELVFDGGNGNINDRSINGLGSIDGYMVVTTWNNVDGSRVWRTSDGQNFVEVTDDGFGDINNLNFPRVSNLCQKIYTGSANVAGAELWSIDPTNGVTEQIVGDDTIPGGFGTLNNYIASIATYNDQLYIGLNSNGQLYRINDLCVEEVEDIPEEEPEEEIPQQPANTDTPESPALPITGLEFIYAEIMVVFVVYFVAALHYSYSCTIKRR